MSRQSQTVAGIILAMENPPTLRSVVVALEKAYAAGVLAGNEAAFTIQHVVLESEAEQS